MSVKQWTQYDLEKKMRSLSRSYAENASYFQQAVLAIYDSDYDQKDYHYLTGDGVINSNSAIEYGIKYSGNTTSTAVSTAGTVTSPTAIKRKYILFIDSADVFTDINTLREYCAQYIDNYLPSGALPFEFAFKFSIYTAVDYKKYVNMLLLIYPKIRPFFTFNNLLAQEQSSLALLADRARFSSQFNLIELDRATIQELLGFLSTSSSHSINYVDTLADNLDNFIKNYKLPGSLLLCTYTPDLNDRNNFPLIDVLALSLAYLNHVYKIPVQASSILVDKFKSYVRYFYNPSYVLPITHKLRILQQFPTVGHTSKEMCDYLVYFPLDSRMLSCTLSYLDNGKIRRQITHLLGMKIYEDWEQTDFDTDLLDLERAMNHQTFLHIGNSGYINLDGVKTFCYFSDIKASYPAFLQPCDLDIPFISMKFSLEDLDRVFSMNGVQFVKEEGKKSLWVEFSKKLNKSIQTGFLKEKLVMERDFYIPSSLSDSRNIIYYFLDKMCKADIDLVGISEKTTQIFKTYNVMFRQYLIHDILKFIPLKRLRETSPYLTKYGTDGSTLLVRDEYFKTM